MKILFPTTWTDYELLDSGDGKRLERFGEYVLVRPDPQIIWKPRLSEKIWSEADAVFQKITQDKGKWLYKKKMPDKWVMKYNDLSFYVKLTPFKHTGVFPEQAVQWDFVSNVIARSGSDAANPSRSAQITNNEIAAPVSQLARKDVFNILNLFGYTGIASLAAAQAGARVTHVDASRSAISWARENQKVSNLDTKQIRWILDDAVKFCQREIKRGNTYDGIIMDPPVYGHGPEGEIWKFSESFPKLLQICRQLLSPHPLFVIVNAYAISSSAIMLQNVLEDYFGDLEGTIEVGELALQQKHEKRLLSTGIFGRWSNILTM